MKAFASIGLAIACAWIATEAPKESALEFVAGLLAVGLAIVGGVTFADWVSE